MRLRWLDLLRSTAILGMIIYHAAYDLQFFHSWNLDVTVGLWKIFQVCVASLFLSVSGISAGFWTRSSPYRKAWTRFRTLCIAAMIVSIATYIADPRTWVRFGILHCIALAAFVLPPLRRVHPMLIAFLGITCIALTPLVPTPPFSTVDWVPPIPWLGPILLGFAAGIPLSRGSIPMHPTLPTHPIVQAHPTIPAHPGTGTLGNVLTWPGRHSLAIYLLHQPVIIGVLWALLS